MGAKFGPAAYLWIVFGCIFAGAVHDYLGGMLSMRHDGAGLPEMIGHYLGTATKNVMLVVSVLLLILVGAVFVYSPALILHSIGGDTMMWVIIIFCYYFIATMLPIDKIIGKVYPLFALSLLFTNCGRTATTWGPRRSQTVGPTASSPCCSSPSPAVPSLASTPRRAR